MNYLQILNRICEVVQQNMANKLKESDEIEWDVHFEILLFYAMLGLKPVGVNRYFMMSVIHKRFSTYIKREISSQVIWDHLESLYDMAALHESEIVPFPNEETDFELPYEEFNEQIKEKFGVSLPCPTDENEAPKNSPSLKSVKKLGLSKLKQNMMPITNAKNAFLTPVPIKSTKSYLSNRNEPRPPSAENVTKGKQESPFPAKINKVKRSSSPFTTKVMKSENTPVLPEPTENSNSKKSIKIENQFSASAKKTPKGEQNPVTSTSKKSLKQELNLNTSRQAKIETPDNSSKKIKNEKEHSNKKGKVTATTENSASKKSSKVDKKNEIENSKKPNDTPTNKTKSEKISSKSLKYDEVESPVPSGSRKSSVGKIETSDKKKKRQKLEEPAKKLTPAPKRRRT